MRSKSCLLSRRLTEKILEPDVDGRLHVLLATRRVGHDTDHSLLLPITSKRPAVRFAIDWDSRPLVREDIDECLVDVSVVVDIVKGKMQGEEFRSEDVRRFLDKYYAIMDRMSGTGRKY